MAPFAPWTQTYGKLGIEETRANARSVRDLQLINSTWHPLHTAQHVWTQSILPNLILTSMGDRMEMAHSIEGRTPFLDHELTRFANHLPPSVKVKVGMKGRSVKEKYVLREAGRPFISQEMYERRKHPFTAPHVYRIGGPMHNLLSRLITSENVDQLGFMDSRAATALVERAFEHDDAHAMRMAFVVAQWVVLSKAFNVPGARPRTLPT